MRRSNIDLRYKGKSYQTVMDLVKDIGMEERYSTVAYRISRLKWSVKKAVETPYKPTTKPIEYKGKEYSGLKALVRELGRLDDYNTISARYYISKWPLEKALNVEIVKRGLTN